MNLSLQFTVATISQIGAIAAPPLLLVLATLPAFLPILDNGFVAWDDDKNFLANPSYRGLGLSNITWAFSTFHLGVYQPLAWILFGLEYTACGLNPRGYHIDEPHPPHGDGGVPLYSDRQAAQACPAGSEHT